MKTSNLLIICTTVIILFFGYIYSPLLLKTCNCEEPVKPQKKPEGFKVTIYNNSQYRVECMALHNGGAVQMGPDSVIEPNAEKSLGFLKKYVEVACTTKLGNGSSTILTYMEPDSSGKYSVRLKDIRCLNQRCRNKTIRATIIRSPSGKEFKPYLAYK